MPMKDKIRKIFSDRSLQDKLVKEFHVDLAILFGSIADDMKKKPQDIDIGLLFSDHLPQKEEENLIQMLRKRLRVDKLDVVCLNHASSSLRYETIRNGILLYESTEDRYVDFVIKTFKEYEEMNFLKRHYHAAKIEELRGFTDVQL